MALETNLIAKLPRRISPCPINEAILEIRFQTRPDFLGGAVFGLLYKEFRNQYRDVQKQPVLQIPEQMRTNDPGLMYLPEYHLTGGPFKLLIGQRVLSVVVAGEYSGWPAFLVRVEEVLEAVRSLEFIDRLERLGLRYINVFDFDIFDHSTLALIHGGAPLETRSTRIVSRIEADAFEHTLTVANGLKVRNENDVIGESIIDIDTATSTGLEGFFDSPRSVLEEAHNRENKLFFSL